jgi:hypothetical protein
LTARPPGTFKTTVQAQLNEVASIGLTVARADRNRLVLAYHSIDQHMPMCTLRNTLVPDSTPPLYATIGLMALGTLFCALADGRLRRTHAWQGPGLT